MFVNTIAYKLLVGISPNLQLGEIWHNGKLIRFWSENVRCLSHHM